LRAVVCKPAAPAQQIRHGAKKIRQGVEKLGVAAVQQKDKQTQTEYHSHGVQIGQSVGWPIDQLDGRWDGCARVKLCM